MDCADEVKALRRTVGGLPGVAALDFDILKGTMRIALERGGAGEGEIVAAVREAGLEAERADAAGEGETSGFWSRRGRLVMCCASGALLLAGLLTHAFIHGSLLDAVAAPPAGEAHPYPLSAIILYMGSLLTGCWFIAPKAVAAARALRPDMNLLMFVAVCGALVIGEWFEAATVTFLFSLALLLESWSMERARRAIAALMEVSPSTARVVSPDDGSVVEKPVGEVAVGSTVLVRPGEKIPLDGIVLKGLSHVNQAPITGESVPVRKEADDELFAGTINGDGALEFRVTKPAGDTTLARIIRMVEEARSRRAPAERWVDTFARRYTPVMMVLAAVIVIAPPLLFAAPWAQWLYRGLVILVIACPCALVISTPVTVVSALTAAARNGVLIKGGAYLEEAARLRAIALDKTGTLTHGLPRVRRIIALQGHTERALLERAAALEAESEHPIARAILQRAEEEGIAVRRAADFRAIKGKGAEGTIGGRRFWIGSHRLMEEKGQETPDVHDKAESLEDAGHSVVALGNADHVCGLISVADTLRDVAPAAVRAMKRLGIRRIVMLTGDNEGTARAVARAAGVDEFMAELLPEDKVRAVEKLARRLGKVAMIGDGVNDAPAMAVSSLGVAMGAMGTDAAIETADVALMSDDLSRLPWFIAHSRRALRIVKENIGFSLAVKAVFLSLALVGIATLWMAIAADMGASLLVIFNGLRLLKR